MGKDGTTEWSTVIPTENKTTLQQLILHVLERNPKTIKVR
jgi:hypothetical protein